MRTLTLASLAALTLVASTSATPAGSKRADACPPTTAFTPALTHLEGYRVFTGADGDSAVEPYRLDARFVPLLKTGKRLGIVDLPKPGTRAPQIVIGAADVDLPMHPAPYREMFIMLGGSATIRTAKFSAVLGPGSVLLFEDTDARIGHGGRTGPCGYVSLSIAPPQ